MSRVLRDWEKAAAIRALQRHGLANWSQREWLRGWDAGQAAQQEAKRKLRRIKDARRKRIYCESRRLAERMARDRDPS